MRPNKTLLVVFLFITLSALFYCAHDAKAQSIETINAFVDRISENEQNSTYRVYSSPRETYMDSKGRAKVRAPEWSRFNEISSANIIETADGYSYDLGGEYGDVKITGNKINVNGYENSLRRPQRSFFIQNNKYTTVLKNIYPGTDFRFTDFGSFRQKEIILNSEPENMRKNDEIIFWENYSFPNGTKIFTQDNEEITSEKRIGSKSVMAAMPNGTNFYITNAVVFDSSQKEESVLNLDEIARFEPESGLLSVGIVLPTNYLRDTERVYPVTIDPVYYMCHAYGQPSGWNNACDGIQYDFYFREPDSPPNWTDSNDIFIGRNGSYFRYGVVRFWLNNLITEIASAGTVTNATVNLVFDRLGTGSYSGNVAIDAKEITSPWTLQTATKYSNISGSLSHISTTNVSTGSSAGSIHKWNITNQFKKWILNPSSNYGILFSPNGSQNRILIFRSSNLGNTEQQPYIEFTLEHPDIVLNNQSMNKSSFYPGENVSINFEMKNSGLGQYTANANDKIEYFLNPSTNCWNTNGSPIGTLTAPSSLAPGGAANKNISYTLPSNISAGSYCLIYNFKSYGLEANKNNNTNGYQFSVNEIQTAKLSIQNFNAPAGTQYTEHTLSVNAIVQNTGNASADNTSYTMQIQKYGSGTTYNLSGTGQFSIGANTSQTINFSGVVPAGVSDFSSNYYVVLALNAGGNPTKQSSNTTVVEQYNLDGGVGGNPPDSDNDGQDNVSEKTAGSNISGSQSMNLIDKPIYITKKSVPTDGVLIQSSADKTEKTTVQGKSEGADPVNLRTGAFEFIQTDFNLPGRGLNINWTRTYNSKLSDFNSRLGNGWTTAYEIYYYQNPTTKDAQIYLGGVLADYFSCPSHDGVTFVPERGRNEILYKDSETGFLVYKTLDGIKYFFGHKTSDEMYMATKIIDSNNNITYLSYNNVRGVPLLSSITDASGRALYFVYPASDTNPLWDKIQYARENIDGADKLVAQYFYDANGNLVKIHQESNYGTEQTKNIDRNFTYDANGQMISYEGPLGSILYNTYDSQGRIIAQYEHNPRVDGADKNAKRLVFELSYLDSADLGVPDSAHCTEVKNYRNNSTHYDEKVCFDSYELKIYSKKGDNIEKWQYNNDGMATKYTDANGNISKFEYDSKRRMTKQIAPDTEKWRNEIIFEYENNFNQLNKKTEKATPLFGQPKPDDKAWNYMIDPANGNTTKITDPAGNSEIFAYDKGNMIERTAKDGTKFYNSYDAGGNYLTSETTYVAQVDGNLQTVSKFYSYDAYGNQISYKDPCGFTSLYYYDSRGNLRESKNPAGDSKYFKYDLLDKKISETDELGRENQYTYDTDLNGSLLKTRKLGADGGIVLSREYDYVGNLVKEIDPIGGETAYIYNDSGRIAQKTDAEKTEYYEYYPNGLLKKEQNTTGGKTDYFYDSRGNLIETRKFYDATNYISEKTEYGAFGQPEKTTDPNGNVTAFEYNKLNELVKQTNADGGVVEYARDAAGRVIGARSPSASTDAGMRNSYGFSMYYVHDGLGRVIKEINAEDKITLKIYDASGNLTKIIDRQNADGGANSHAEQYTYDNLNRKQKEISADGGIIEYTYNKIGNTKTKKDQMGRTTEYFYDDYNQMSSFKDSDGFSTFYTYDKNGNKLSATSPKGEKTEFKYNSANRLIQTKDALGGVESYEYDGLGNKTKITDKRGFSTLLSRDLLGRLTQTTDALGGQTVFLYDKNSNIISENTNGVIVSYEYDGLNRPTKMTRQGIVTAYAYDKNGNKISETDGTNKKTNIQYDKLDRISKKTFNDGNAQNYSYDNWNNLFKIQNADGSIEYEYSATNFPTKETRKLADISGKTYITTKTYDKDGAIAAITHPDNQIISYSYDSRGLPSGISADGKSMASYTYNQNGSVLSANFGNGTQTQYAYDALGRKTNIRTLLGVKTLFEQRYTYDADGNTASFAELVVDLSDSQQIYATTTYTYDAIGQLLSADYKENGDGNDFEYTYDLNGNRLMQKTPAGNTNYIYFPNTNRLQNSILNNRLSVDYEYDANGAVIKEKTKRLNKNTKEAIFSYDSQNRLSSISYSDLSQPAFLPAIPTNTIAFDYDVFGDRIKKTVGDDPAIYYINDGVNVSNEIGADGKITKTILQNPASAGALAEIGSNGIITYIHADSLGSRIGSTDDGGNIASAKQYGPFGEIAASYDDSADDARYSFTNQEYDTESDLYYYNARYYDPKTGRFLSIDPILSGDNSIEKNGYAYANNNPIKYTDPTGKYGVDFHFYNIYYLARTAGYEHEPAYTMAKFSQYVDDDPSTAPEINGTVGLLIKKNKKTLETFHFYSEDDSVAKRSPKALRNLIKESIKQNDMGQTGVLLHIYADTWSHEGYGWNHGIPNYNPDKPYLNIDKAIEATKNIFCLLSNGKNIEDFNNEYTNILNALSTKSVWWIQDMRNSKLYDDEYLREGHWKLLFEKNNINVHYTNDESKKFKNKFNEIQKSLFGTLNKN